MLSARFGLADSLDIGQAPDLARYQRPHIQKLGPHRLPLTSSRRFRRIGPPVQQLVALPLGLRRTNYQAFQAAFQVALERG
jgi:hypothetical protein